MATVNAVIIPSQKKKDGTWNVKIRVNKDGRSTYIETPHFVNAKQIWKKNQIKDPNLASILEPLLTQYRKKISEIGVKLEVLSSKKLAGDLVGCFGHMLHPIPRQTDHLFCWQRNAAHALAA